MYFGDDWFKGDNCLIKRPTRHFTWNFFFNIAAVKRLLFYFILSVKWNKFGDLAVRAKNAEGYSYI